MTLGEALDRAEAGFDIDLFKDRRNKEEDKETRSGCQIEEREEEEMK